MQEGRPQEYLDEFIRLEGRGDHTGSTCSGCRERFGEGGMDGVSGDAVFTCEDCFGTFMECASCILMSHRRLPFHRVQVRLFFISYFSTSLTGVISTGIMDSTSQCPCES